MGYNDTDPLKKKSAIDAIYQSANSTTAVAPTPPASDRYERSGETRTGVPQESSEPNVTAFADNMISTGSGYADRAKKAWNAGRTGESLLSGAVSGINTIVGTALRPVQGGANALHRADGSFTDALSRTFSADPDAIQAPASAPMAATPMASASAAPGTAPAGAPPVDLGNGGFNPTVPAKVLSAKEYQKKYGQIDQGYFAQGGDKGSQASSDPYGYAQRLGLPVNDPRVLSMNVAKQEGDQRRYQDQSDRAVAAKKISDEAYLANKLGYSAQATSMLSGLSGVMAPAARAASGAEAFANESLASGIKQNELASTNMDAAEMKNIKILAKGDPEVERRLISQAKAAKAIVDEEKTTIDPLTGVVTGKTKVSQPYASKQEQLRLEAAAAPAQIALPDRLAKNPKQADFFAKSINDIPMEQRVGFIRKFMKDNGFSDGEIAHPFFQQFLKVPAK